jgi:HNH endonuclease
MTKRRTLPVDVRVQVLHEAGYRCGNPICRMVLTLDVHHLDPVSDGGPDTADNLLALCPNCHSLHHRGVIPKASLRAWKLLLLALNQAFDTHTIDVLLTLSTVPKLFVSGEGVLQCAGAIASGLVSFQAEGHADILYVQLTPRGRHFVNAWKNGDQNAAITLQSDA